MGSKQTTYLEINGRRYDAVSGELLDTATTHQPRRFDDVKPVRKAASPPTRPLAPAHHAAPASPPPQPKRTPTMADVHRMPGHHTKAHATQHSQTLKRSTVSKPVPGLKRQVHAQTNTGLLARTPSLAVAPKWSFQQVDQVRLKRAEHIAKSKLIQRFAPVQADSSLRSAAIIAPATATAALTPATQPVPQSQPGQRSMDIFQKALKRADAHEQPPVNHKKLAKHARAQAKAAKRSASRHHHRLPTIVTASLAFLLLAGFITYQNRANITLRYADAKAGFHATLPGYKPAGFAIGSFSYRPGAIGYTLHNDTSGKSFSVLQQSSDWDSQTLLESFVATQARSYQTLQSGGRTIYVYGDNNAAWVNGGVWYRLNTNGSLSTSEIVNVATSM